MKKQEQGPEKLTSSTFVARGLGLLGETLTLALRTELGRCRNRLNCGLHFLCLGRRLLHAQVAEKCSLDVVIVYITAIIDQHVRRVDANLVRGLPRDILAFGRVAQPLHQHLPLSANATVFEKSVGVVKLADFEDVLTCLALEASPVFVEKPRKMFLDIPFGHVNPVAF